MVDGLFESSDVYVSEETLHLAFKGLTDPDLTRALSGSVYICGVSACAQRQRVNVLSVFII